MAVVVVMTWIFMGPLVGISKSKAQGGQELSELEAPIVVAISLAEELLDVAILGHVGLQGHRQRQAEAEQGSGSGCQPTAHPARVTGPQENPSKPLPPLWEALGRPRLCWALTGAVLCRKG